MNDINRFVLMGQILVLGWHRSGGDALLQQMLARINEIGHTEAATELLQSMSKATPDSPPLLTVEDMTKVVERAVGHMKVRLGL